MSARKRQCVATVPLLSTIAWRTPSVSCRAASARSMYLPCELIHPEESASLTDVE